MSAMVRRMMDALVPPRKEQPVQSLSEIRQRTDYMVALSALGKAEIGAMSDAADLKVAQSVLEQTVTTRIKEAEVALKGRYIHAEEQELDNQMRADQLALKKALYHLSRLSPEERAAVGAAFFSHQNP